MNKKHANILLWKNLLKNARKKAEKAKRKREQRKTPYPFGFEYRSERK